MNFMEILLKRDIDIEYILKEQTLQDALLETIEENKSKFARMDLDIPKIVQLLESSKSSNSMLNWTAKDVRRTSRQRLADLAGQERQGKWGASKRFEPSAENPFSISLMVDALHQIKNDSNRETTQKIIEIISEEEETTTSNTDRTLLRREETLDKVLTDLSQGLEIRDSLISDLYSDKVFTAGYLILISDALMYAQIDSTTEEGKEKLRTLSPSKKIHPDLIDKLMEGDTLERFKELLEEENLSLPKRQGLMASWKRLSSRRGKTLHERKSSLYDNKYRYKAESAKKDIRGFNRKIDKLKIKWDTVRNSVTHEGEFSWSNIEETSDQEYENDSETNQREKDRTRRLGDNKDETENELRNSFKALKSYIYAKYILIKMINEKEENVNYDNQFTTEERQIFKDYEDICEKLIGFEGGDQETQVMSDFRELMREEE